MHSWVTARQHWLCQYIYSLSLFCVALGRTVEELSSSVVVERPLLHLTLLQDYPQPLERYHDYEDDDGFGELRAESTLSEKFGSLLGQCLYLLLVALASCYPHFCLVTVCLNGTFGHDCSVTCDDCSNGGLCNIDRDGCDCPDGWTAIICNRSVYFIFCITIKFEIVNIMRRLLSSQRLHLFNKKYYEILMQFKIAVFYFNMFVNFI